MDIRIAVMRGLLRFGLELSRSFPALQRWLDATALRIRPPAGVTVVRQVDGPVVGEWLIPADAASAGCLLFIDGSHLDHSTPPRAFMARLAAAARIRIFVTQVAASDDAVAAFDWLRRRGLGAGDIAIAGAGSGGGLALAALLCLRDRGEATPGLALLISPRFDGRADPALTADLRGLPPLLVHAGDAEPTLGDCVRLRLNAEPSGFDLRLRIWPDMGPMFHAFAPYLREANDAIAHLAAALRSQQRTEVTQPLIRATFAPRLPPRIQHVPSPAARGV